MNKAKWTELERTYPTVPDLRAALRTGIWGLEPDRFVELSKALGNEREELIAGLLRLVMWRHLDRLPADPLQALPLAEVDTLPVTPRAHLYLLRYPEGTDERWTLTKARAEAAKIFGVTPRTVRRREYALVSDLAHHIAQREGGGLDKRSSERNRAVAGRRRQNAPEATALYQPTSSEEMEHGFWWRAGTKNYVTQLAQPLSLTLFAGADGNDDVGPPLHRDLIASVLGRWAAQDPLLEGLSEAGRTQAAAHAVSAVAAWCPSEYLGSILRQSSTGQAGDNAEETLQSALAQAVGQRRTTSGFVARGVAYLAFIAARAKRDVRVITTHFDSDIEDAQRSVHAKDPSLSHWSLAPTDGQAREPDGRDGAIDVVHLYGRPEAGPEHRMALGELDLLADIGDTAGGRDDIHPRRQALRHALENSTVLFIGTSLSDPAVITELAETKDLNIPRYAILLPPDRDFARRTTDTPLVERALARKLLSQRYLHLGVIPIIADFEHQVPQILREVALRIDHGRYYEPYADRVDRWWASHGARFGQRPGRSPSEVRICRKAWQRVLAQFHGQLRSTLVKGTGASDEVLMTDMWLRNPDTRSLFRWASSPPASAGDSISSAHLLAKDIDVGQRAFREGRIRMQPVKQDPWRYRLSVPLVVTSGDWYHLPIGVMNVWSSSPDGALSELQSDPDATARIEHESAMLLERLLHL